MSSSSQISIRPLEKQQQYRAPPSFWDNLSRQFLIPRALKEFDRRAKKYQPPIPLQPPSLRSGRNDGDLKRFAQRGGPSLADLRGYHRAVSSNFEDRSTGTMPETRLDTAFEEHLVDKHIFINNRNVQPENQDEIIDIMNAPRSEFEESGFTNEKFQRFLDRSEDADTDTAMSTVIPLITGDANTTTANNLSLNLEALTDGSLTKPVPSCCDGLLPSEIDSHIRQDLGRYIAPSKTITAPCLPNFFLEGVASDQRSISKRRGCYCGTTLGARGVHKLRSYVDPDTALDNRAYTVVATYYPGGNLELYTIHPAQLWNDDMSYYMTRLGGYDMNQDLRTFRGGVRALRNARDWAMRQRKNLADAANAKRRAQLPAAN